MDVKLDIHYTTPIPMSKIAPSLDKLDNKNDNLKFSIFTTNLKRITNGIYITKILL